MKLLHLHANDMSLTVHKRVQQREGQEVRFICRCSFLEIYKEVITDLLNPAATRLQIREDFKRGIYVEGLHEHITSSGTEPFQDLLYGLLLWVLVIFARSCRGCPPPHMMLVCFRSS